MSSGCSIPIAKRPIGASGSSSAISNVIEQLLTRGSEPFPRLEGTVPVDLTRVHRQVVLRVVQDLAPGVDCGDTRIVGRRNDRGRSSGRGTSNHGASSV